MKTQHLSIIMIILMIGFSACREITVTTDIHEDGSFTRTITVTGDDDDVFDKDLPYPVADGWTVELTTREEIEKIRSLYPDWMILLDTTIDVNYILTYKKTYRSVDLLNQEMNSDTSWMKKLNRRIEIDKRFGFFYSYITFREIYESVNPFTSPNIDDYLTEEELRLLAMEEPSGGMEDPRYDEVEQKATDYLKSAAGNAIITTLRKGIEKSGDTALQNVVLENYRDSIDIRLEEVDFDSLSEFIDLYAEWTGVASFNKLKRLDPPLFETLDKDWQLMLKVLKMEAFEQKVRMPGMLTNTNSIEIIGNQVSWPVEGFPILLADYEMIAESRVVNYWAFVLTGTVVLSMIILLVLKAFSNK
jgi:hypothetical protein